MKESTVIKFLQDKEQSDYRLNESGEQLSDFLDEYAESHTQAHTEGLRERVKELEDVIRRSRNRLGNILSDDDLTDEALREHSERLLPSIHDDLNRVIYKEEMK